MKLLQKFWHHFFETQCSDNVVALDSVSCICPTSVDDVVDSGYAADEVTHCIRPEDVKSRRAVVILRRWVFELCSCC